MSAFHRKLAAAVAQRRLLTGVCALLALLLVAPAMAQKGEEDPEALAAAEQEILEAFEREREALEREMQERLERLQEIERARQEGAESVPVTLFEEVAGEVASAVAEASAVVSEEAAA